MNAIQRIKSTLDVDNWDLAFVTGKSQNTIKMWESGTATPDKESRRRLARMLEMRRWEVENTIQIFDETEEDV